MVDLHGVSLALAVRSRGGAVSPDTEEECEGVVEVILRVNLERLLVPLSFEKFFIFVPNLLPLHLTRIFT